MSHKNFKWSYCSLRVDLGNYESLFNGIYRWFADNWRLRKVFIGIWSRKMLEDIKRTSGKTGTRTISLRFSTFDIIRRVLIGVQCFKANNSFKTIFQPQFAESFNSMVLIRICEYLVIQSECHMKILKKCGKRNHLFCDAMKLTTFRRGRLSKRFRRTGSGFRFSYGSFPWTKL